MVIELASAAWRPMSPSPALRSSTHLRSGIIECPLLSAGTRVDERDYLIRVRHRGLCFRGYHFQQVLPMFTVNFVTYLPGCSRTGAGTAARSSLRGAARSPRSPPAAHPRTPSAP